MVTRNFVSKNGAMALYNGLSAGFLRQLTYGLTRLGIFRTLTNHYSDNGKRKLSMVQTASCSLVAGGIGALVGTPADAALIRMQADSTLPVNERRNYKNGVDAMIRMAREEGVKGFFSGAFPTIIRGLALNVGMLASYDKLKEIGGTFFGSESSKANIICASTFLTPCFHLILLFFCVFVPEWLLSHCQHLVSHAPNSLPPHRCRLRYPRRHCRAPP